MYINLIITMLAINSSTKTPLQDVETVNSLAGFKVDERIKKIISARLYSDLPKDKRIELKPIEQSPITKTCKKWLYFIDAYKFDMIFYAFLTLGLLLFPIHHFIISTLLLTMSFGIFCFTNKTLFNHNRCRIEKSQNHGTTEGNALEIYAGGLTKENARSCIGGMYSEFIVKSDLSLHPKGFGVCYGAAFEFIRLYSLIPITNSMTDQDHKERLSLIASLFKNGAPVNAVILQRLANLCRDSLWDPLKPYGLERETVDRLAQKHVLHYLADATPGIYLISGAGHARVFIKIHEKLMVFFDSSKGTYCFSSLDEMGSTILPWYTKWSDFRIFPITRAEKSAGN